MRWKARRTRYSWMQQGPFPCVQFSEAATVRGRGGRRQRKRRQAADRAERAVTEAWRAFWQDVPVTEETDLEMLGEIRRAHESGEGSTYNTKKGMHAVRLLRMCREIWSKAVT